MNIREALKKDADRDMAAAIRTIREVGQRQEFIDNMPEIELPQYSSVWMTAYSLTINTGTTGEVQRVAGELAAALEIKMEKIFNEYEGTFTYRGEWKGIRIIVNGSPPANCELEEVEQTELVTRKKYRVKCENGVGETDKVEAA